MGLPWFFSIEEMRRTSSGRGIHRAPGEAQDREVAERGVRPAAIVSDEARHCIGPVLVSESAELAWKLAPELELSIDVGATPVNVRLVGTLDGQTGNNIRSVIEELVHQGHREFSMHVEGLQLPDPAGFSSLVGIQRLIKSFGGSIEWSRWPDP